MKGEKNVSIRWTDKDVQSYRERDIERLCALVDEFALEMKARLKQKALEGYAGWENHGWNPLEIASEQALAAFANSDDDKARGVRQAIDTANYVMFGWNIIREQERELQEKREVEAQTELDDE